jgi:hypothetical protein
MLVDQHDGYFGLKSRENGYFWVNADSGCVSNAGCKVQIWTYELPIPDNARWKLIAAGGSNFFKLQNKQSQLFLNADGPNVHEGSRIQLYTQTGGDNEIWQFIQMPN